jgi:hypothetical protein
MLSFTINVRRGISLLHPNALHASTRASVAPSSSHLPIHPQMDSTSMGVIDTARRSFADSVLILAILLTAVHLPHPSGVVVSGSG